MNKNTELAKVMADELLRQFNEGQLGWAALSIHGPESESGLAFFSVDGNVDLLKLAEVVTNKVLGNG